MTTPEKDQPELSDATTSRLEEHPKVFISYSWTSEEHEKWVVNLASQLREDGADVILDKWDLHEGDDAHSFMERIVTDPSVKKVLLICDHRYVEKANARTGGVGTEAQILTGELYGKVTQDKFVAIVLEQDEHGKALVPAYYSSRVFIDMRDADSYAQSYEQMLRWIYGKPVYTKPDLGHSPGFLMDSPDVSLGTTTAFRRALDAIKSNKEYWLGALSDYSDALVQNLGRLRIAERQGHFDDQVIASAEQFLPYRNEAIAIFKALARYRRTPDACTLLHNLFERLIPYLDRNPSTGWNDSDFDNFRFIVHELFLYEIAILLREKWFEAVAYLLDQQYYVESDIERRALRPFAYLRQHMRSLDERNERLAKETSRRRYSIRADLLKARAESSGVSFEDLMAADFVLYLRDALDGTRVPDWMPGYWPETLVYLPEFSGPMELFARAQSALFFEEMKVILRIASRDELQPLFDAMRQGQIRVPRWEWHSINPAAIIGFTKLATKP